MTQRNVTLVKRTSEGQAQVFAYVWYRLNALFDILLYEICEILCTQFPSRPFSRVYGFTAQLTSGQASGGIAKINQNVCMKTCSENCSSVKFELDARNCIVASY